MKQLFLITGSSKGIGLATAQKLIQLNHEVIVTARTLEKAKSTARQLGPLAHAMKLDMEDYLDHHLVINQIQERWGKLDGLINNAAVFLEKDFDGSNAATIPVATVKKTFEGNFFALINLTQLAIPLLKRAPVGRIVNVTSILGSLSLHSDPNSPVYNSKPLAYNASKTALNAFTVHLAHALKDTKIKVNSIHPGWVKTDMGGEMAPMTVEEGARTSVAMALLDEKGPSGIYIHQETQLPW